jgi:MoaA/NifB/PqqE/SkfB family radical SAM enzyme
MQSFKSRYVKNTYNVQWSIGNTCNWSCEYCPTYLHNGSKPWPDKEVAFNFALKLIALKEEKDLDMRVEFVGGEVTLCPYFIELSQFLHQADIKIEMISNGSRTEKWWSRCAPYLHKVNLTYHPHNTDPTHYKDIILLLKQYNVEVTSMIAYVPDLRDICETVFAKCVEHNIPVYKKILVDKQHGTNKHFYNYQPDDIEELNNQQLKEWEVVDDDGVRHIHSNEVLSNELNQFKGMTCCLGQTGIVIDMHGNVRLSYCYQGKVGNIKDDHLSIEYREATCKQDKCKHVLDWRIPKVQKIQHKV